MAARDSGAPAPQKESSDGQGSDEVEQGSAQAEEGQGQDQCLPTVPEGRPARAREPQEQLAAAECRGPTIRGSGGWWCPTSSTRPTTGSSSKRMRARW